MLTSLFGPFPIDWKLLFLLSVRLLRLFSFQIPSLIKVRWWWWWWLSLLLHCDFISSVSFIFVRWVSGVNLWAGINYFDSAGRWRRNWQRFPGFRFKFFCPDNDDALNSPTGGDSGATGGRSGVSCGTAVQFFFSFRLILNSFRRSDQKLSREETWTEHSPLCLNESFSLARNNCARSQMSHSNLRDSSGFHALIYSLFTFWIGWRGLVLQDCRGRNLDSLRSASGAFDFPADDLARSRPK